MKAKIYQLETTNFCNANCSYCPHRKMKRSFGFVSFETVEKVYNYCKEIGQDYIALHHMGEPLLHKQIDNIIMLFEKGGINTEFSTNGALLAKHGRKVLEAGLTRMRIAVDYNYDSEMYKQNLKSFLKLSKDFGTEIRLHSIIGNAISIFEGYNPKAILEYKKFDNWAGEVNGESELEPSKECYFRKYNYVVVLWDGRIVPCCMDYDGKHVIGNINSIRSIGETKACAMCKGCANLQFAEGGGWKV